MSKILFNYNDFEVSKFDTLFGSQGSVEIELDIVPAKILEYLIDQAQISSKSVGDISTADGMLMILMAIMNLPKVILLRLKYKKLLEIREFYLREKPMKVLFSRDGRRCRVVLKRS